ncbi:MAG: carboxypeptidase-like regulatory domain-containing protein [Terracidiphilus sp.]
MSLSFRSVIIGLMMSAALFNSAQNLSRNTGMESASINALPDAPNPAANGSVRGTVTDADGALTVDAQVVLKNTETLQQSTSVTNESGAFQISSLPPGSYKITVSAKGFAPYTSNEIIVHSGEAVELNPIVLQVARASEDIVVALSRHEIAEEQIHEEEKQRLGGIFPEFFISYKWNAAPLSTGQKFELAWKSSIDPTTFIFTGAIATYEQARNNLRPFGQGTEGFAKRYGVNYADAFSGTMISGAILPSIFREDPRYFVKQTGSVRSRIFHAMEFPFVCRGDNGRPTPNLSFMLGDYLSAELSNTYYPPSSRTNITASNMLLGFAGVSVSDLMLEFVYPHITTHIPRKMSYSKQLILRTGSPVTLIVTENATIKDGQPGAPVSLALTRDVSEEGVLVAKAGSKATGVAIGVNNSNGEGKTISLEIHSLVLEAGDAQIPLKASKGRTADTNLYRSANSKVATVNHKIQIPAGTILTAYVAADISLHPAQ